MGSRVSRAPRRHRQEAPAQGTQVTQVTQVKQVPPAPPPPEGAPPLPTPPPPAQPDPAAAGGAKPTETTSNVVVPTHGVSLAYLRELPVARDLTFYEVCKAVVLPPTKAAGECSYAEFLLDDPDTARHVAPVATVFVSYAWAYTWGDFLACVEGMDGFAWVDCFTVNQHKSDQVDLDTWLDTFSTAIAQIGSVVFLVTPWSKPINMSRAWCVFEILVALEAKVKTEVRVPPREAEALRTVILNGDTLKPNEALWWTDLSQINVQRAQAFKEEDRLAILRKIEQRGAVNVNDVIMQPIREFVEKVATDALQDEADATPKGSLARARTLQFLSGVLAWKNRGERSVDVAKQALEAFRAVDSVAAGTEPPDSHVMEEVYNAKLNVGVMLSSVGNWPEAVTTFEEVLEYSRAHFRAHHPLAIVSSRLYASGLIYYSRFDESVLVGAESVEMARLEYGDGDTRVIDAMLGQGAILNSLSKVKKAKRIFTQALAMCVKTLPPDHPSTAIAKYNLAVLKKRTQEYDEALELLHDCLFDAERVRGKESSEYAGVLELIAQIYLAQGHVDKAIEMGTQALLTFQRVYPPTHQQIQVSMSKWGMGREATLEMNQAFLDMEAQVQANDVDDEETLT